MRAPILLVDDTPANLLGLQAVLAASDHELVSVGSGPEALAQLEMREFAVAATYVLCDRDRVQQVLANLIGNAIKFTRSRGAIDIGASGRDGEVVVSVGDTGVGIRDDHVPYIFEPYWKADPERKNGAGLGLSIARAIVEAHGGRIWVETEAESGSRFYFTLRAAAPSAAVRDEVLSVPTALQVGLGA